MSATPPKNKLSGPARNIPIRRVMLSDPSQLPSEYSTTPGGTLFSTTPGGTRIIYDRAFLMQCRESPLAKSPPPNLPKIPGVTSPETAGTGTGTIQENGHNEAMEQQLSPGGQRQQQPQPQQAPKEGKSPENAEEPQFEMDIWSSHYPGAFRSTFKWATPDLHIGILTHKMSEEKKYQLQQLQSKFYDIK